MRTAMKMMSKKNESTFKKEKKLHMLMILFRMVSMRSGNPMFAPLPLSEVSPTFAFETVPMFARLTMALSHPFSEDRLELPLSTPLSSRRPIM